MLEIISNIVGFILLWMAVDFGRSDEDKVKFMGRNWWVILLMLTIGSILISSFIEKL